MTLQKSRHSGAAAVLVVQAMLFALLQTALPVAMAQWVGPTQAAEATTTEAPVTDFQNAYWSIALPDDAAETEVPADPAVLATEPVQTDAPTSDTSSTSPASFSSSTSSPVPASTSSPVVPDLPIANSDTGEGYSECFKEKIKLDETVSKNKRTYRIAVHAIRGFESAMEYYNTTFETYLSATAGQRFDPPINFELVPVTFEEMFERSQAETVDFVYANPGSYSCIGVEVGAHPLVTTVSEVSVRGHTYDLDVFGGVIFTRADNKEIYTITDLKDKVIGAGAISVIMGGQTQLFEMVKAGMDYVMDPKQVVFTGNQFDVVAGVLSGEFDVGFVRTDQIERSLDENGDLVDPDLFRVLQPRVHILDDGTLFPFLHSTDIFPEWPVAALPFVPDAISVEVQAALLALSEHSHPWEAMTKCQEQVNLARETQDNGEGESDLTCDAVFWKESTRCDSSPVIASLAYRASQTGNIAGFRSPRSYFGVRTMHERAGFMAQDDEGDWSCTRAESLYDSLTCPPDHYKLSRDGFDQACGNQGLSCQEGYDCYCKPCVRAFEVDVFQYHPAMEGNELANGHDEHELVEGCEKMSICGRMAQQEVIYMKAIDNQKRDNATVEALIHIGQVTHEIPVRKIGEYSFEFSWSEVDIGVGIVEVYINGEQIPESPIRVQVVQRSCDLEVGGASRVPDDEGQCICADGTVEIGGSCITTTILAVSISLIVLAVAFVLGIIIIRHKNYKSDLVWRVDPDDLLFDDPPEIIGEGAFGVVVLAEYRGTKVAIKKALKGKTSKKSGSRGSITASRESLPPQIRGRDPTDVSVVHSHTSGHMSLASSLDASNSDADVTPLTAVTGSDVEAQQGGRGSVVGNRGSGGFFRSKKSSTGLDLGFLAERYGKGKSRAPWAGKNNSSAGERFYGALSVAHSNGGSRSGSMTSKTMKERMLPCFNKGAKREAAFITEMRLLSSLRHPCICTIMGAVMTTNHTPMIVMEYMEYGSLHDLLRNETMYLSGEIILQIMRDVTHGLRYLHSARPPILHGDLKPPNILIDNRFRAKVCDFGLSVKQKNSVSGSLFWLAPEYLIGSEDYTASCDLYSMGIILNEIYSRQKPYYGEDVDLKRLLLEICDRKMNKRPVMHYSCPPRMAELVKKLWSRDPSMRPQSKELDMLLMDMDVHDAEPRTEAQANAKPRTDDMLYEIFPKHVAEALKAGKKVEPESHDMVTIVFSDIKGFTDISREISPMKVSMMLDRLYLAFDRIAGKHGVFKVETIGDAYMGVANLVEKQDEDHVKRIAEFAVDMIDEAGKILIDEDEPRKGYISIRVGFHSGPVVSNVIGSLNPRYGLFGDSVNTASRMESNSLGSKILCSESSYALLKQQAPDMPVKKRGKIAVKGKGDMTVYWVGEEIIRQNKSRSKLEQKLVESEYVGIEKDDTQDGPRRTLVTQNSDRSVSAMSDSDPNLTKDEACRVESFHDEEK